MREKPTIGEWLGRREDLTFDPVQVERLWHDVQLCYLGKYRHVFRCFVKSEPHKKAKIEQKRWRLIMCASLAMQMLWRMALTHQNEYLNSHAYETPSAHGVVFCYGGWRRFKADCKSKRLRYSRDISSWDINAPGWIFRVIKRFRQRAGGPPDWLRTLDILYKDAFEEPVIKFSLGILVRQLFSGVMKSGLFSTISDNSLGMVGMHALASVRSGQRIGSVRATGDDVLQELMSAAYLMALEKLGCRVKEVEERLVFMGTDFTDKPKPMYLAKHLVNFWTDEQNAADRLDSYARLWCHDEKWFAFWDALARKMGFTLRSRSYYEFWYDSPMARFMSLW